MFDITVSNIQKCCCKYALDKKLKFIRGSLKYFLRKSLGHEIFRSMVSWAIIFFCEKPVKPSGLRSYILNVRSLNVVDFIGLFRSIIVQIMNKASKLSQDLLIP